MYAKYNHAAQPVRNIIMISNLLIFSFIYVFTIRKMTNSRRQRAMQILRKSEEYDKLNRLAITTVVLMLIMFALLPMLIAWHKRDSFKNGDGAHSSSYDESASASSSASAYPSSTYPSASSPTTNIANMLNKSLNSAFSDILKDVENTNLLKQ